MLRVGNCSGFYGDRLSALLRYRADLFEPATAKELLAQLEAILRRMVEEPDQKLSALRLALLEDARARHGGGEGPQGPRRGRRKAIAIPG